MTRVVVCGLGAVSPAGWSVAELRAALAKGEALPVQPLVRPGNGETFPARLVPLTAGRPQILAHPRLRRASAISHYATAAALEAVSGWRPGPGPGARLGLIVCLQSGCVQYSCRFCEEMLKDPATASPLLFPETVFASLASHIGTLLGGTPLACSIVGDPACFLQGVATAAAWLDDRRVEACLVLGAEESHWLLADALRKFDRGAIISCGAGALCLSADPAFSLGVELAAITDVHTYSGADSRHATAAAMRAQLPAGSAADLLCDGLTGSARADAAEQAAWRYWPGARLSPRRILGEGLAAATAWQCVAACDALVRDAAPAANVSLVGLNQQAIGARFARS